MANTSEPAVPPPGGGKRRLLLVGAAALVLAGAAAGGAYFLGLFGGGASHAGDAPAAEHVEAPAPPTVTFVDVPEMLVNLQATGSRMRFLKLKLALEVPDDQAAQGVRALMPRIQDSFQLYLRALTAEDLAGPGGVQRLKEDLLARGSLAVEPIRVRDVLLKEMLVQ